MKKPTLIRRLDLLILSDGEELEVQVSEPESGECKTIRNALSFDEHPEFDAQLGGEVYDWLSLWRDAGAFAPATELTGEDGITTKIRITAKLPVAEAIRPVVGAVYDAKKVQTPYDLRPIYFICVRDPAEQIGVFPNECEEVCV